MPDARSTDGRWWREWDLLLLAALVLGLYVPRLTELPLRGEESRWARVAVEMLEGGDWVVPRQQGAPFLSRPPLGSWLIAAASTALGGCSPRAVRLPTVLATLATTLLIYGYARQFLSRVGALASGLAYVSSGTVLGLGRLAETDATFTMFVAGSLMVWHWGRMREWLAPWPWVAGYSLAALGALTKGPQAPAYFVGTVGAYLLVRRDFRALLSGSHLAGLATFLLITGAWLVPFYFGLGGNDVWSIWSTDVRARWGESSPLAFLSRSVTFSSALLGSLLPWSFLLFDYLRPSFRKSIGAAKPYVVFWVVCLAVTMPTCWLVRDPRTRYYMPIFPGIAVLTGLVIDRAISSERSSVGHWLWAQFLGGLAALRVVIAVGVVASGRVKLPLPEGLWLSARSAVAYLAMAGIAAGLMLRSRQRPGPAAGRWGLVAVAAFLGLTFLGPILGLQAASSEDVAGAVARFKAKLPPRARLVSFGPVHHLFAYYYRDPIELRPLSPEGIQLDAESPYFCIGWCDTPYRPFPLPYFWEPVATISCERTRRPRPLFVVTVGRRLSTPSLPTPPQVVRRPQGEGDGPKESVHR